MKKFEHSWFHNLPKSFNRCNFFLAIRRILKHSSSHRFILLSMQWFGPKMLLFYTLATCNCHPQKPNRKIDNVNTASARKTMLNLCRELYENSWCGNEQIQTSKLNWERVKKKHCLFVYILFIFDLNGCLYAISSALTDWLSACVCVSHNGKHRRQRWRFQMIILVRCEIRKRKHVHRRWTISLFAVNGENSTTFIAKKRINICQHRKCVLCATHEHTRQIYV